ncbi:hypothetical protein ACKKBF_B40460 [Auxenochlorella protothecoides x Auxenochlorella symbiontica]
MKEAGRTYTQVCSPNSQLTFESTPRLRTRSVRNSIGVRLCDAMVPHEPEQDCFVNQMGSPIYDRLGTTRLHQLPPCRHKPEARRCRERGTKPKH